MNRHRIEYEDQERKIKTVKEKAKATVKQEVENREPS